MKWVAMVLLMVGVLLLGLALFLALHSGMPTTPSYLADWLFWSSLPFGALPVVMLIDLVGPGAGLPLEPALRRLLILTPVAAVLMIPVLVLPATLFGWANGHGFSTPFGRAWMNHGWFIGRSIIYVGLWTLLAVLFRWPPRAEAVGRRRGFAAAGLCAYALSATLASVDWAMTVEPNWFSAEFGLLLVAAQVSIAVSAAILLSGRTWRLLAPDAAGLMLISAVGIWLFAQFIQFLVIWSGDKASDIAWYLHRSDLGSRIAVWMALAVGVVVPVSILSSRLRRRPAGLIAAAVLVVCTQALGMLWLITPSLRHHFTITGMDVLALAGIGGVMLGICLLIGPLPKPAKEVAP
ncbi:hypothetical protein [Rhodopila globiformis]|uniref:Quinol:cytochrome C oxidoreductase n=1 Tax=Rhodopila globiformis TaxID=1071 RepID=A0A2S6NPH3_RHOGL|nr:hypothetical protein [Rhodopila globiformis]PPQ40875.1 hypothetical protein CCS01_00045 [Rhodopila globiformis]